ncbi:efflux RND transporter periplasmic adaptor subunit [Desulfovibrio sp. OttesenSCG-928-M14]|nr:efflux RND transporter periplasmic adaptor subunit [Desulfovibrio sp. OttesenSCG-928-M14]
MSARMFQSSVQKLLLFLSLVFPLLFFSGCKAESPKQQILAEVRYADVQAQRLTMTRSLPGRISAFKISEVRPQVGGIIHARLFAEGSEVEAGQVLYQIDPALYQAAYNNAKANLGRVQAEEDAARLLAERYTRLAKTNAVSVQDRDDAVAAYNRLKAEIEAVRETLESASINLGYTRITAPVSGRIGRSAVTEGALVTQNQEFPLARIQLISPVYVDLTQSNAQLLRLRRAFTSGALTHGGVDSARVRLYLEDGSPYIRKNGAGQDEWIEGALLFSDITVDESTGTVFLRAKFDNPEGVLLPGMYVRAELIEGVLERAVLVPQKSVGRDARNRPQIFVLAPSSEAQDKDANIFTVEARSVTIERDYGNAWLLGEGLEPGELIVIDGISKVRHGQKVRGSLALDANIKVSEWTTAFHGPQAR